MGLCGERDVWSRIVKGRGSETVSCCGVQVVLVLLSSARCWGGEGLVTDSGQASTLIHCCDVALDTAGQVLPIA